MRPVKAAQPIEVIAMLGFAGEQPPIRFAEFAGAPRETLETLLLARLNLARNLRGEINALIGPDRQPKLDELIERMAEHLANAKVAELLLQLKASYK